MGRDRILTDERLQKASEIFKTEMQGIEVLDKQKISYLATHKDRVDSHNTITREKFVKRMKGLY